MVHHILINDDILDIFDPFILFDTHLVSNSVYNMFFALSASKDIVYQIELLYGKHHVTNFGFSNEEKDPISCACACYLNLSNTSLRSIVDKSAGMAIITGH